MSGKLKGITDVLDMLWEDLLYDPATKLPTLFDVDEIDARWLKHLKPLLGFTADIPFTATDDELRRILRVAIPFWNKKPAEEGVIDIAIRMVTGNRFRVGNYFDFRSQVGATVITEELEDFDPSVIAFFAPDGEYPAGTSIDLGQVTADGFTLLGSGFPDLTTEDQEAFLVIEGDTGSPSNDSVYPITSVLSATSGKVDQVFPRADAAIDATWKILFYMDEFITEARVVEHGRGTLKYDAQTTGWTVGEKVFGVNTGANGIVVSDDNNGAVGSLVLRAVFGRFENDEPLTGSLGGDGAAKGTITGVLNRDLISYLISVMLPISERVNIVYINFLDQFLTPHDLDQWTVSDAANVAVPDPGGAAVLQAGENIIDADNESVNWDDQTVAWKIEVDSATAIARCLFYATDVDNCYVAQIDYSANELKLFSRASAVDTQIGSTVSIPVLKPGVQDVVRVDALAEGSNTRIRVKVNGELRIDALDSPASFTAGRVGFEATGDVCRLKAVEVNVLPCETQRVGLNP